MGRLLLRIQKSCRAQDADVYEKMVQVELATEAEAQSVEGEEGSLQASAELYDSLCRYVHGDALTLVKSAPDCQGFMAWHRLRRKYSPRTLARGVKLIAEVVSPTRAKDISEVEGVLCRWEEKVRKLRQVYREELQDDIKIAVFTNLMPPVIQDFIYTTLTTATTYDEIKDRVMALIANKAVNLNTQGRAPMDIGLVGGEGDGGEAQSYEADIDAVSSQCHKCGGWGHFARECPSKGKGKGKGKGKDGGKDGGGKGVEQRVAFKGACHNCGEIGHKIAECTVPKRRIPNSTAKGSASGFEE